jgi:hypothetical protein
MERYLGDFVRHAISGENAQLFKVSYQYIYVTYNHGLYLIHSIFSKPDLFNNIFMRFLTQVFPTQNEMKTFVIEII